MHGARPFMLTNLFLVHPTGLHRQVLYGGLRIGLYEPIKRLLGASEHESSLVTKVGAGLASGAIAICVASPTDLVKVCFRVINP